jgi:hypothetical protein
MEEQNMTRRLAVLIGSPLGGLQGVATDIASIGERLEARGFSCTPCVGAAATRKGILEALEDLRDQARPDDAIVVYYSGHGGRCHLLAEPGSDPGPARNYLVPMDHDREHHFRGVADFELALLFHDLSKTTRNVTVLLDCCHASTMVRGDQRDELFRGELEPEPQPHERARNHRGRAAYPMPDDMKERYAEFLRRQGELHDDSNPHVVRVVATSAGSPAFELRGKVCVGYLTLELCAALDESLHAPMAWDTIIRRVRERIALRRRSTTQRPELEGPRGRLPFSLDTAADIVDRTTLVYRRSDGTPWVRAGKLHGLHLRDQLDVLGAETAVVAKAEIVQLFDDHARIVLRTETVTDVGAEEWLPPSGSVVAFERHERRRAVWVDPSLALGEAVRDEIDGQARLRRASEAGEATFRVVGDAHELRLEGPSGIHRLPRSATVAGVTALVHDLDDLARSSILEEVLASPPGLTKGVEWKAEVFVEPPGEERRRLEGSEPLRLGTRVHAELSYATRAMPTLYVNVLDRGISRRLSLLNVAQPAGVQLQAPTGSWTTLAHVPGLNQGMRLTWPGDVPRMPGLTEELVFVVSQRPLDLRDLLMVDGELRQAVRRREIRDGAREMTREPEPLWETDPDASLGTTLSWDVRRVGFEVVP